MSVRRLWTHPGFMLDWPHGKRRGTAWLEGASFTKQYSTKLFVL